MKYRNDFKISFTRKPDFFVDKKNKTVKCYLNADVITPKIGPNDCEFISNFNLSANGYAKCDKGDIFDPEIGKKIALARAESKIYHKAETRIFDFLNETIGFFIAGENFIGKADGVIDHNENYIDDLTNNNGW